MNDNNDLWVDKYRPTTLKDYVLNSDIKSYFLNMVKSKQIQNFMLAGILGSGKTSLARIICNEIDAEVLFVRCATEGTLDVLRTKMSEFCNSRSFEGKLKICVLDELDSSSSQGANNFQLALRTLIEQALDDTRFICTCNTVGKIIPAVLSRCPVIPLKFDQKDLLKHVKKILDNEKIEYDKDSLKAFIEESFHFYPDCRRIINYLQLCCNSGKLIVKLNQVANSGKDEFLKNLINLVKTNKNILDVRRFYLQHKDDVGDMVMFGSELFNYAVDNNIVSSADGVLKLTDMLFQLNQVVDKEPTLFGMIVAISRYGIQK